MLHGEACTNDFILIVINLISMTIALTSYLFSIIANDPFVFTNISMSSTITYFPSLAHEIFQILPAKNKILFDVKGA